MNPAPSDCLITGLGLRCSVGQNVVQSCASIRAGIARFADWFHFAASFGQEEATVIGARMDPDLGDRPWIEKLEEMATQPLLEALWMAGLDGLAADPEAVRWGLYLATPEDGRPGIEPEDLADFREDVNEGTVFQLDVPRIVNFAGDHAEGLQALGAAMKDLARGRIDLAVVGGVDSLLHSEHLYDLLAAGRLKTDLTPAGLIPGETAAFVVVETRQHANRRRAEPLARLTPVRTAQESVPAGRPSRGDALATVFREILNDFDFEPQRIHVLLTDLNGERWRFLELAMAKARALPNLYCDRRLWHPADCIGDVGAATAATFLCVAARAFQRGYAAGDAIPISTSSTSGLRAVVGVLPAE